MLARLHQMAEAAAVHFRGVPMRMQYFQPAFFFEVLDDLQRVVLVRERGNLMTDRAAQDVVDVFALLGGIVAGLRALFDLPMETRCKTGGPNQARRVYQ